MNSTELIVRLIIKRADTILLCINKETKSYFLPGGHVEFGDTLEETIYKETHEELGWTKEDIKNISFKTYLEHSYTSKNSAEPHHELNMIFNVEIDKDTSIESQEPHIDFEWMPLNNVKNIKILPTTIVSLI